MHFFFVFQMNQLLEQVKFKANDFEVSCFTWDKWGWVHTFVHGLRNVCGICLFNAKILALWAVVLHPSYAHIFKMYGWIQPELRTMDIKTLEEEHNALLLDKAGVIEYLQTLPSQIETLKVLFYSPKIVKYFL